MGAAVAAAPITGGGRSRSKRQGVAHQLVAHPQVSHPPRTSVSGATLAGGGDKTFRGERLQQRSSRGQHDFNQTTPTSLQQNKTNTRMFCYHLLLCMPHMTLLPPSSPQGGRRRPRLVPSPLHGLQGSETTPGLDLPPHHQTPAHMPSLTWWGGDAMGYVLCSFNQWHGEALSLPRGISKFSGRVSDCGSLATAVPLPSNLVLPTYQRLTCQCAQAALTPVAACLL